MSNESRIATVTVSECHNCPHCERVGPTDVPSCKFGDRGHRPYDFLVPRAGIADHCPLPNTTEPRPPIDLALPLTRSGDDAMPSDFMTYKAGVAQWTPSPAQADWLDSPEKKAPTPQAGNHCQANSR